MSVWFDRSILFARNHPRHALAVLCLPVAALACLWLPPAWVLGSSVAAALWLRWAQPWLLRPDVRQARAVEWALWSHVARCCVRHPHQLPGLAQALWACAGRMRRTRLQRAQLTLAWQALISPRDQGAVLAALQGSHAEGPARGRRRLASFVAETEQDSRPLQQLLRALEHLRVHGEVERFDEDLLQLSRDLLRTLCPTEQPDLALLELSAWALGIGRTEYTADARVLPRSVRRGRPADGALLEQPDVQDWLRERYQQACMALAEAPEPRRQLTLVVQRALAREARRYGARHRAWLAEPPSREWAGVY